MGSAEGLIEIYKTYGDYKNALKYSEVQLKLSKNTENQLYTLDFFSESIDFELKELENKMEKELLQTHNNYNSCYFGINFYKKQ